MIVYNTSNTMERTHSSESLRHRIREPLYNHVPVSLKNRSLTYYRSLIQQADEFSCGSRMLAHADILTRVAYKTKTEGISFETNLINYLSNQSRFEKVHQKIKSINPEYDYQAGLYDDQIYNAIEKKFPLLKDLFLTVYYDATHGMTTLDFTHMECETYQEFCADEHNYIPLAQSRSFRYLLNLLKNKYDMAHLGCLVNNHWFLATVMINQSNRVQLLVIDSENREFKNWPDMHHLVDQLLHYVKQKNEEIKSQMTLD